MGRERSLRSLGQLDLALWFPGLSRGQSSLVLRLLDTQAPLEVAEELRTEGERELCLGPHGRILGLSVG